MANTDLKAHIVLSGSNHVTCRATEIAIAVLVVVSS